MSAELVDRVEAEATDERVDPGDIKQVEELSIKLWNHGFHRLGRALTDAVEEARRHNRRVEAVENNECVHPRDQIIPYWLSKDVSIEQARSMEEGPELWVCEECGSRVDGGDSLVDLDEIVDKRDGWFPEGYDGVE